LLHRTSGHLEVCFKTLRTQWNPLCISLSASAQLTDYYSSAVSWRLCEYFSSATSPQRGACPRMYLSSAFPSYHENSSIESIRHISSCLLNSSGGNGQLAHSSLHSWQQRGRSAQACAAPASLPTSTLLSHSLSVENITYCQRCPRAALRHRIAIPSIISQPSRLADSPTDFDRRSTATIPYPATSPENRTSAFHSRRTFVSGPAILRSNQPDPSPTAAPSEGTNEAVKFTTEETGSGLGAPSWELMYEGAVSKSVRTLKMVSMATAVMSLIGSPAYLYMTLDGQYTAVKIMAATGFTCFGLFTTGTRHLTVFHRPYLVLM
jgi:hypothetical protein